MWLFDDWKDRLHLLSVEMNETNKYNSTHQLFFNFWKTFSNWMYNFIMYVARHRSIRLLISRIACFACLRWLRPFGLGQVLPSNSADVSIRLGELSVTPARITWWEEIANPRLQVYRCASTEPICVEKRGRCRSCDRKVHMKCEHRCTKCHNFVRGKHANKTIAYSCIDCSFTTSADAEWLFQETLLNGVKQRI